MLTFILLIVFEIKHFFCDWQFQTAWMVSGKGRRHGWMLPLLAHAGLMHGFWTAAIMAGFTRSLWLGFYCGVFDTVCHFIIDRLKASPNFFGKYRNQDSKAFWVLMGADQMLHHLTYFAIIFYYPYFIYFIPA